jgi:hypothetical protein
MNLVSLCEFGAVLFLNRPAIMVNKCSSDEENCSYCLEAVGFGQRTLEAGITGLSVSNSF